MSSAAVVTGALRVNLAQNRGFYLHNDPSSAFFFFFFFMFFLFLQSNPNKMDLVLLDCFKKEKILSLMKHKNIH